MLLKMQKEKILLTKIKQLEIELVKNKNVNNPNKLQSELKEFKKLKLLITIYMKIKTKH